MFKNFWKRSGVVLIAGALALAGCQGDKGPTGEPGQTGNQGDQGEPGVSTGTLAGTVKSQAGDVLQGITVTTDPLALSATTGADGSYTLANVPAGVYAVTFAGANAASKTVTGVSMLAGQTITQDAALTYSPIKITFTAPATPILPVGFGKTANVAATVTGATGTLAYTWTLTGPTTATITADTADSSKASFTTGTIAAIRTANKVQFWRIAARKGLVPVSAGQTANLSYVAKLKVSDGKYEQTATVTIPTVTFTAGAPVSPVGVPVIANDVLATNAWTLEKPAGSAAALEGAATANPYFIPDVAGTYVLKNGAADATPITIVAATWTGSSATCGNCHTLLSQAKRDNVALKFKQWSNSAHGNHFWKFMEYDGQGNLVWKASAGPAPTSMTDASGKTIFWTNWATPGRMTLPEYGLSNAEGAHYGNSCIGCHAVGFNLLVSNNGFDDQAGYAFPASLLHDTGDLTKPDPAAWNAIPAGSKARAGIQCENCHGPLSEHRGTADTFSTPKSFFDSETCAVCHDRATNHDRYQLWAQGGHANLELAVEEGTSSNCGRCHSAQGFVAWSKHGFDPSYTLTAAETPSEANVQPITCVACHDPHTTTVRERASVTITSGFTVTGAGAGQLCVVCHSSRRGLHNDANVPSSSYSLPHPGAQSDLFFGQNAFFIPVDELNSGSTMAAHAFVLEGTCAGCHMERELANESLVSSTTIGRLPTNTNHSFKVNTNVCGKCHEGAQFEALKEKTEAGVVALKTAITDAAKRMLPSAGYKLSGVSATINGTAFTGVATFSVKPDVVVYGLPGGAHGTGFTFHYNTAPTATFLLADNATIPGGADAAVTVGQDLSAVMSATGVTAGGAAVYLPSSDLFKATWNMALIEEDLSFGAHNPNFAQRVLGISLTRAQAIPTAP